MIFDNFSNFETFHMVLKSPDRFLVSSRFFQIEILVLKYCRKVRKISNNFHNVPGASLNLEVTALQITDL